MSALEKPFLTPEEYLEIERKAEFKSEYCDGQMFAMAGASRRHNLIAGNVSRSLGNQLDGRPCETYQGDMRVEVSAGGQYTYPDIVVVCGEPQFRDETEDTLLNPTLIVEVLSPSTEAYDRAGKFARFRRLASLQEYILIAQNEPRVERYARQLDNQWLLSEADDLGASVNLTAIGCTLKLADVYARVTLPAPPLQIEENQ